MARILKEGKLPETQEKECNCPNCETIFVAQLQEFKYISGGQREDGFWKIECPFCHKTDSYYELKAFSPEKWENYLR